MRSPDTRQAREETEIRLSGEPSSRGSNDPPDFQLSNFFNIEDPETGHIVVTINRYGGNPGGAHTYVLEVQ